MPTIWPALVSPAEVSSTNRAMPKSPIFSVPSASVIRFPGFTSRCTTPCRCAAASPAAAWAAMSATRAGASAPPAADESSCARLGPWTSSMTR